MRSPLKHRARWVGIVAALLLGGRLAALEGVGVERVVLQLPFTHQFQFAGIYAADSQGYFREAGLEVEVRTNPFGKLPLREVREGRAQYGIYQAAALLRARLEGEPVVVLAAIFQHSPYVLAALRESGIRNPQDLAGKRIALESEFRAFEIGRMLQLEGVDDAKVQFVPNRWEVNELETGEADVMGLYVTDVPFDLREKGLEVVLIRPADYGVDFYGDTLFTTEDEVRKHPARVRALRQAVLRGWDYALRHRTEMIDHIFSRFPDRPAKVTRARLEYEAGETARLVNRELIELGSMNPGRWRAMADTMLAAGVAGRAERLRGLVFAPETAPAPAPWARFLGWTLAGAGALAAGLLLVNRRLQRLVEERTRALQASEAEQRALFDRAPVAMMVMDYSAVAAELAAWREAGVTDPAEHLRRHPDLVITLVTLKRIKAVNAAALAKIGCASMEELDAHRKTMVWEMIRRGVCTEQYAEELRPIWEGRTEHELEQVYRSRAGEEITALLSWSAAVVEGRPDYGTVRLAFADITAARRAERALRGSEQRYHLMFALNPSALLLFDADTLRIVDANEAALRQYGYGREELLGLTVLDIRPPEDRAAVREVIAATRGQSTPVAAGQWRHVRKDGSRFEAAITAGPVELGGRVLILSLVQDITVQEQALRDLRASEERYRQLFEGNPNPMWIADAETLRFVAVNDAAVRRYGYSREEFLGMTTLDIRPPEDAARLHAAIRRLPQGDHGSDEVWRHRRKDGSVMLVQVRSHTIVLNGRTCHIVLPFDLTEKLQAEAALRESEQRYRELVENSLEGIYRSLPDGRVVAANSALARMLGFDTPQALLAWMEQAPENYFYVQAGRRAEFARLVSEQGRVINFESELRRRDGSAVWISENARVVKDAAGQVQFYEGFLSDISDRSRLEAEQLRASKLEAVGLLAGGIAHDFNNILTVVLGNVTLAEMDSEPDSSVQRLLRDAKKATLRARDLTQQLLTFAKGGDPVRDAVALPELLRESAGFALHGAKARGEFAFAPDLWAVNADKVQLGQVVQNLVINAVQAMPGGGVVRLEARNARLAAGAMGALPAGDYVELTVRDTGVGIAPEHLAKVFDPYFTTKQQGSGLGLATVYSVVRKHQGHLTVESVLGVGTTFRLWLPAAAQSPGSAPAEPVVAAPLRARVLFMDDEEPIREMAGRFIRRFGAECELVADGAAAVAAFRAAQTAGRPFDVVVMDLTVPGGMGGREAMAELRQLDPAVRAVVSSGYSRDPVLGNYREHGFQAVLPKPYGLDQLRKVLLEVVDSTGASAP